MFNAALRTQLDSPDQLTRLRGVLALCCNIQTELANAIAEVVLSRLPLAAKASWDAESEHDDNGGYVTCIGRLSLTLIDGTTLAFPDEADQWERAHDTQCGATSDPLDLGTLEAIEDHDGYMAWLATRVGVERHLLDELIEALLAYAYAVQRDGWLSWRPIQPPAPVLEETNPVA